MIKNTNAKKLEYYMERNKISLMEESNLPVLISILYIVFK